MPGLVVLGDDIAKKMLELERIAPGTINKVATQMVIRFKDLTRDRYMSGQILGEKSGKSKKSIWDTYKKKGSFIFKVPRLANIFEQGATIKPGPARALHFVNDAGQDVFVKGAIKLKKRPFWSTSWKDFIASSYADRIAKEVIDKEWTRRFN